MRSSASLALALVAPLAFAIGCAPQPRPPATPEEVASLGPPRGWRDPSLGKETRSTAMVGTGIALLSVGTTMLPIGSLMAANAGQSCETAPNGSFSCRPSGEEKSGLGVLAAGAGALAVGIPLLVLGLQKVPIEVPRRAAITVGPTGASFRYDF